MGRTSDARDRLVDSARELVAARGYSSVGVNDVCKHAGVKKGSFYYFFPSKQELAVEALEHQWAEHEAKLAALLERDAPALDRFRAMLEFLHAGACAAHAGSGSVQGCLFGNMALEMSTLDEPIRRKVEEVFRRWRARVAVLLREAMDEGVVPEQDPDVAAESLIAYLEGVILFSKTTNDPTRLRRLGAGAYRVIGAEPPPDLARAATSPPEA